MEIIQKRFKPLVLTTAGRPKLVEEEIELRFSTHCRVYLGDNLAFENGSCWLSTHRVSWRSNKHKRESDPKHSFSLSLEHVSRCWCKAGVVLISSPKIVLELYSTDPGPAPYMMLSFRDNMRNAFYSALTDALRTKPWQSAKPSAASARPAEFSTRGAGIKGLMAREQKKHKEVSQEVDSAFRDLSALMANAGQMVSLVKKFSDGMRARDAKMGEEDKFNSMLADMGIPSPVTRKTAGTAYHDQLARQLSDFFESRLGDLGGIVTLPDAFCLFNRARGTEMVSPDDLMNACRLLSRLSLPLVFRTFQNSNVMVLQSQSHSDEKVHDRITELARTQPSGVSALEASRALQMSLVLTKQHILTAERAAKICRDKSSEGVRFYVNLFIH